MGRRALGVAVTTVATLILTPLFGVTVILFQLALTPYDTTGRGGPLRTCDVNEVHCSAPAIWLAVVWVIAYIVFCVLAAMAGVAAGGFEHRILAALLLTVLSAGVSWVVFLTVPVVRVLLTPS